ncbi:MAG: hypothetical protein MI892_08215 [Desulfobacterales bacterium]|nr:hypothetical protein [Desulfobacterales bacterium]
MISMRQRGRNAAGSESEVLQTDIMRFFAIICLCLMIIFALVQSLPVSETIIKPKIHSKQLLEQQVSQLEQKADMLNQVLMSLKAEVATKEEILKETARALKKKPTRVETLDRIAKEKEKNLEETKRLFSVVNDLVHEAKAQKKKIHSLTLEAKKKLAKEKGILDRTSQLIAKGKDRLGMMEKTLEKMKQTVAVLEKQKAALEAGKKELKNPAAEPKPPVKSAVSQDPVGTASQKAPVQAHDKKEGFSLGFKSNQDLMHLLKQGKTVQFFMLSGERAWLLLVHPSGSVSFVSAKAPATLYTMVRSTVPEKIILAGRKVVAAFGKAELVYGVTLTSEITAQFGRLMQGKKGGDLVIDSRRRVSLE